MPNQRGLAIVWIILGFVALAGVFLLNLSRSGGVILHKEQKKDTLSNAKFSCENNEKSIQKRGYIFLMGFADHHKEGWIVEKSLMEQDPKAAFVVIYDQDERLHLTEISQKFKSDLDDLLQKHTVQEVIFFGSSAGGVTASHAIGAISKSYPQIHFVLHTMSSPLKGYGFPILGRERGGFYGDITAGIPPFDPPGENVTAYHHKTVTDTVLKDRSCSFCDPIAVQNNNLIGSKEFFYPQYDHNPLMQAVVRMVLPCYNPALPKEAPLPSASGGKVVSTGLGDLCLNENDCNIFCKDNLGRCKEYCRTNPQNPLCLKPFDFQK